MPVANLQAFKLATQETSSSTKQNNMIQALEDLLNGLDNANLAAAAAIAVSKLAAGAEGTTLQTIAGVPTWAAGSGAPQYGTTLPASPSDGQEAILVDSLTNPTYAWRFRWNAGSAHVDKWEFVGGAPKVSEVQTGVESTSSTGYAALTTAGPSITVPRSGVYYVEIGAHIDIVTAVVQTALMSYDVGATGASDNDAIQRGMQSNGGWLSSRVRTKTLAANDALVSKYRVTGGTAGFNSRWMKVVPVRVS